MAKSKLISRIGALALAAALACTSLISASAATIDKATIDMDAKAQLSIYKYRLYQRQKRWRVERTQLRFYRPV